MDPINFWDPYGLGTQDFAHDFLSEGVVGVRPSWSLGGQGEAQSSPPISADHELTESRRSDIEPVRFIKAPPGCEDGGGWCSFDILIASPIGMARGGITLGGRAVEWLAKTRAGKALLEGSRQLKQSATQLLAGKGLPRLSEGPGGKMLGEAIGHLKNTPQAERVEAFRDFAGQITEATAGQWSALEFRAQNATVFAGEGGEALVFDAAGNMFRGHLADKAAFVRGEHEIEVIFELLKAIK